MFQSGFEAFAMALVTFLVAYWFKPSLLGQLGMLLAGVQLIVMISDGFPAAIIRFVSGHQAEKDTGAEVLGWNLCWYSLALVSVGAVLMGLVFWAIPIEGMATWWIVLAVLLTIARTGRAIFDSLFRALRHFTLPVLAGTLCTLLLSLAICYFSYRGHRVGYYLGMMVIFTALNTLWLIVGLITRHRVTVAPAPLEPRVKRSFYEFIAPLAMRGAIGFLFLKINIWIIGWLATDTDAGHFRLTDNFLTIPMLLTSSVLSAIAPRIVQVQAQGSEALQAFMSRIYGLMVVLAVPFVTIFLLGHPLVMRFFPDYEQSAVMLLMFVPATAVMGIGYASSVLIIQGGYPAVAFWLTLIPSLANVLLVFAGFALGGTMGLMAATATVHFITYAATTVVAHRLFRIPFRIRFLPG